MIRTVVKVLSISGLLLASAGCDTDNLLNQTASFGGDIAGGRSQIHPVIINNTPYRAIFTMGVYDDLDQYSVPQVMQFGNDPDTLTMEGDTSTLGGGPSCSRVFAIGTPELLNVIRDNLDESELNADALIKGIYFSSAELGSEEGAQPTEGVAPPFEARLGVDFACNSSLVIRFEIDDVGPNPFRIDFEVIPATDDRNPPS